MTPDEIRMQIAQCPAAAEQKRACYELAEENETLRAIIIDCLEWLNRDPDRECLASIEQRMTDAVNAVGQATKTPSVSGVESPSVSRPAPAAPHKVIEPQMILIPGGTLLMGSPEDEPMRWKDEGPQHLVTVPSFWCGRFAVTFGEWDAYRKGCFIAHNPDDLGWGQGNRPVINVSWDDAKKYITWLNEHTGKRYRLLSEAEWEYACRA